jgi:hypothetical protein
MMEEDLGGFQHFNYKLAQREPKSSLEEASVNYNFVSSGAGTLLSPPALTIDMSQKYLPLMFSR